jgi:hypothetical protein
MRAIMSHANTECVGPQVSEPENPVPDRVSPH